MTTAPPSPPTPRRPTSADVAREAGLSRATVGYVLNDVPNQTIPERTRQRVFEAAARLGYTPSAAARSLRSGRSELVLCLLADWPIGPSVVQLLSEVSERLAEEGLTLVTHQRPTGGRPLTALWRAISPAAVLVLDEVEATDAEAIRAAGVSVTVVVRDGPKDPRMMSVTDERVGRVQAEHLATRGRRRLGYAYPSDERVATFARPRLRGAEQGCAELGLDRPDVRSVALEPDSLAAAVRDWRDASVDGICAYNDELAIALMGALRREGLTVPGDVSVVGVDDIPLARVSDPPLTTVVTAAPDLARYLVDVVLADLHHRTGPPPQLGSDVLDLVLRDST